MCCYLSFIWAPHFCFVLLEVPQCLVRLQVLVGGQEKSCQGLWLPLCVSLGAVAVFIEMQMSKLI